MYIVLIYDIKKIGSFSSVQSNVFKICKKYLYHVQRSVFEGDLSKIQITKLILELKKYLRMNDDSVIIFKSRNSNWLEKEIITNQKIENRQFL